MAEPRAQANLLRRFVYGITSMLLSLTGLINLIKFGDQTSDSGITIQIASLGGDANIEITNESEANRKRKKPRTDSEPSNLQTKKKRLIDRNTSTYTENSAQELNDLSTSLRLASKKLILPSVNWVKKTRSFLFSKFYVDLQQEVTTNDNTSHPIELYQLFELVGGIKPYRILIESKPGYGKTTLSVKIMYDWANGEQYLKQFDLAFRIVLRDLKEKSLEEELQLMVKRCNNSKPIEFNKSVQEKTLLILDGFDELSEDLRKEISEILHNQKFIHMTVVVTCRSGLFPLEENYLRQLLPPHVENVDPEFYDKKVTILGVGEEKILEFVSKFCPNENPEEVIADIAKLPNNVTVMLRSPLLLFLVCYFNAKKLKLVGKYVEYTVTDLYESLINNIVRTNLTRNGKKIDDKFDPLCLTTFEEEIQSEITKHYYEVLKEFGRKCFDNLMEDCYRFEPSPLMDEVYSLGLLVKYDGVKGLYEEKPYYESYHQSFVEFFAAFFIFSLPMGEMYWKKLPLLLERRRGISMVYVFLEDMLSWCDVVLREILSETQCKLFEMIEFWRRIDEMDEIDGIGHVLFNFVVCLHEEVDVNLADFYKSEKHARVLKYVFQVYEDEVYLNPAVMLNLPIDVTFPHLILSSQGVSLVNSNLTCDILTLRHSRTESTFDKEVISVFNSLNAKSWKVIHSHFDKAFLNAVITSIPHAQFCTIDIKLDAVESFNFLFDILAKHQVFELICKVKFCNEDQEKLFPSSVLKCSSLAKVKLVVSSVPNLDVCFLAKMKWEFRRIECFTIEREDEFTHIQCKECAQIDERIESYRLSHNLTTRRNKTLPMCPEWRPCYKLLIS